MLADIHIHSGLIDHTSGNIDEIISLYSMHNFITILEHFSPEKIKFPGNDDPSNTLFWKKVPLEYPRRSSVLSTLKKNILDAKKDLPVFISLEFDYADKFLKLATSISKEVDYLTLSSHYVPLPDKNILWPVNFKDYFDKYVNQYGLSTLVQEYYINILKAIDTNLFRVVVHLDLIKSFARDNYEEPLELIDAILDKVVEKDIFLEINIKKIESGQIFPSLDIIKRYLHKKGTLLIMGSDSHSLDDIKRNDKKWALFIKYINNYDPVLSEQILSILKKTSSTQFFKKYVLINEK